MFKLQYSAGSMWIREKCMWTALSHFIRLFTAWLLYNASHGFSQSHPEAGEIKHDPVYFTSWIWSPYARKCHSLNKGFTSSCAQFNEADSSSLIGHARLSWLSGFIIWRQGWNVQRAHVSLCSIVRGCGCLLFVFVFHSCFCAVGYWKNMNKYHWFCNMTLVSLSLILLTW